MRARKTVQAQRETYMYGLIAIQGIIERTDILGSTLRKYVNLTRIDGAPEGRVIFIRDDEPKYWLSDGHCRVHHYFKPEDKQLLWGILEAIVIDSYPCISIRYGCAPLSKPPSPDWKPHECSRNKT